MPEQPGSNTWCFSCSWNFERHADERNAGRLLEAQRGADARARRNY